MPSPTEWAAYGFMAVAGISGAALQVRLDDLRAFRAANWHPSILERFTDFRMLSCVFTGRHRNLNDRRTTTLVYIFRAALLGFFIIPMTLIGLA